MNAIARFSTARLLVSLALLFCACIATAQQYPLPTIQQGNWDISVWVAGATGEEITGSLIEARLEAGGIFVGRVLTGEFSHGWRRGTLEYGVDVIPLFTTSKTQKVRGAGFEPVVLRWNSSHHLGPVAPYTELAGGGMFTNANIPPGNTSNVNFTVRAGGGIHVMARDRQSLDLGCHWWHISNANLGVDNPQFNGIQLSLGYHWFR
jgi:hypothetical protein